MKTAPWLSLALLLLLAACGDDGGGSGTAFPDDSGGVAGAPALCLTADCGAKQVLLDLPSAENLTFSPEGRLFVSGGFGVFEIGRDAAGAYQASPIAPECGAAAGLAVRAGVLYAVCSGQRLFAGRLLAQPQLKPVFDFTGMCIPNGMSVGPDGHLYVVDEPLNVCVPDPKIVRLRIDAGDPLRILGQETWVQGSALGQLHLGIGNVLRFPNGLQRRGNRFFGTDGGSVYAVDWLPDGGAGPVQPLSFQVAVHDDLGIAGENLLVTDFATGRILLLSAQGEQLQSTARLLFSFPSSVRLGRPPLFRSDDILVTETGLLTDNNLPIDRLSLFRRQPP